MNTLGNSPAGRHLGLVPIVFGVVHYYDEAWKLSFKKLKDYPKDCPEITRESLVLLGPGESIVCGTFTSRR